MAYLPPDILEQILIRLDVRDLIQCKSVSKSWLSVISDPLFIKAHLNRNYHRDRNNEVIANRRLVMSKHAFCYMFPLYEVDYLFFDLYEDHLIGSADGLVCLSPSQSEILLLNPLTREVSKLRKPQIPEIGSSCWGFGCDSSTNDYKVVLGFRKDHNLTCFQVLSLSSNTWKVIGDVNYTFISRIGILCKGALHWVVHDNSPEKKKVILSFHLSEGTFGEVAQPDDARYQSRVAQFSSMHLGCTEDCLCIYQRELLPDDLWIMKDYNVKQSWEMFGREHEIKHEIVHCIKQLKNYIPNKRSLCHETRVHKSLAFLGAPIYVRSLVSPHFHRTLKRKRQATDTMRSAKVKVENCGLPLSAIGGASAGATTSSGIRTGSDDDASTSGRV